MKATTIDSGTRPSIIFVANRPFGLLSSRVPLMRLFQKCGWRVIAATAEDKDTEKLREMGVVVHEITFSRKGLTPGRDVVALWNLTRLYRRYRPTLVHHFNAKPIIFGNLAACLIPRASVVNTITGLGKAVLSSRLIRGMAAMGYRLSLRRSDMTVFQNPDDHELFVGRRWVAAEKTRVILSSGVDLERFRERNSRELRESSPRVLMAARILWSKGVAEFVEAAKLVRRSFPDACLQLAGEFDPVHPDAIEREWVEGHVNAGTIEFLGYIEKLEDVLPDVYVCVLPSYREGVPRVLLEASACAVPVITTDVPGCREALVPESSGLLVPPKDARKLADAILRLLENRDLRDRMGRAARQMAVRRFDIKAIAKEYSSIYSSLGSPVG